MHHSLNAPYAQVLCRPNYFIRRFLQTLSFQIILFISCQFFGLFLIYKCSSSLHLCSFDECFELVFLYFDEWSKFDFLSSIHEPPYPHIFTPIESASFSKPVVRTTIRNSLSFRYFVFSFLAIFETSYNLNFSQNYIHAVTDQYKQQIW